MGALWPPPQGSPGPGPSGSGQDPGQEQGSAQPHALPALAPCLPVRLHHTLNNHKEQLPGQTPAVGGQRMGFMAESKGPSGSTCRVRGHPSERQLGWASSRSGVSSTQVWFGPSGLCAAGNGWAGARRGRWTPGPGPQPPEGPSRQLACSDQGVSDPADPVKMLNPAAWGHLPDL